MTAKAVTLDWKGLSHLKRALPAIVRLRDGSHMVLLRLEGDESSSRVVLQDPNASEDALLVIDQPRFEDIWSGDVVMAKRDYEISDETQPFSFGFVTALLFRERRILRDVALAALILGFMGLAPIMFWRLLSDKVIFYKAYNTFYVLCLAMFVVIMFEAAFSFLRAISRSAPDGAPRRQAVDLCVREDAQSADRLLRAEPGRPWFPAISAKCSAFAAF
jgi:subfamily B ATP-binding cassette protein HlyB/CyaB